MARHISSRHAGVGNYVSNWDFPVGTYRPNRNRWEKAAISEKEHSDYIRQELVGRFLSSGNGSIDRKQIPDYQRIFTEEYVRELAKQLVSINQTRQTAISSPFSPTINQIKSQANYNAVPSANLQIFGFRGYVCDKCLMCETHYVAFPDALGQGRFDSVHFCDPVKAAAAGELVDRLGMYRFLRGKISGLIKQKVNSWTGKNNHLVALKLSSPPEEIIKLRNPANSAKPGIVFRYSEQRHLTLEPTKENNNKDNYLIRAIKHGATLLKDEELIDFLENIRNATFGIVRVHGENNYKNISAEQGVLHGEPLQSYFVYVR